MIKRNKVITAILAGLILFCSFFAFGNDDYENYPNAHVYIYYIQIYNDSSRNIEMRLKSYKSDFGGDTSYFRYKGKSYGTYLEKVAPGEYATLILKIKKLMKKKHACNLDINHWMCERSSFTHFNQRISISRENLKPEYLHNGQVLHNKELGEIASSAIAYTHEKNFDKDTFHNEIVKKMGLDPDKAFGQIVKAAISAGMKKINKSQAWGSYKPHEYYYQLSVTDERMAFVGEDFNPATDEYPSRPIVLKSNI